MLELLRINNKELELKAAELEIRHMENRKRDKALYETINDEALKEGVRVKSKREKADVALMCPMRVCFLKLANAVVVRLQQEVL
ncbi:hypothetical protein Tco_0780776 [Tanacetum coccineum]